MFQKLLPFTYQKILFLLVTLFLTLIQGLFLTLAYLNNLEQEKIAATDYGESIAANIELSLEKNIFAVQMIGSLYQEYGDTLVQNFEKYASQVVQASQTKSRLFIAPNGIVEAAYPPYSFKSAIHANILKDPLRSHNAQTAIASRKTTIAGPMPLLESEKTGFVIRTPLYDKSGSFKAFSIIVLEWNRFVEQLHSIIPENSSFNYGIWSDGSQGNEDFFYTSSNVALGKKINIPIQVPNDTWHLSVEPADGWNSLADIRSEIVLSMILWALVMGIILVVLNLLRHRRKAEIQKQANEEIQGKMSIIQSLSEIYFATYLIDFKEESVLEINAKDVIRKTFSPRTSIDKFTVSLSPAIDSQHRGEILRLINRPFLEERLINRKWISSEYFSEALKSWCRINFIPVKIEGGRLVQILMAFQNIQEEKEKELRYQESLQKATHEAKMANEAKSTFLFNMSHDIRTPMNAIIGFAELLEQFKGDEEKRDEYIANIKTSSKYLLDLINGVLETARIESGKMVLQESPSIAANIVDELGTMFTNQYKAKNLKITRRFNLIHSYVYCDETKLKEIFLNILSNAVKYTPDGGSIHIEVDEVRSTSRPGYIDSRIVIRDTGIGMSKEFLPRIYDSFSRAQSATESRIAGTGLGMSIVKKMIDLMEGSIKIESELGKGTTVTCCLSLRIVPEERLKEISPQQAEENGSIPEVDKKFYHKTFDGRHILLVEDNDLNCMIAKTILEEVHLIVDVAENGLLAVEKVKNNPGVYDLVLMDIQMPIMNGYDATRAIRNMGFINLPIYAMTANAFEEDKQNAIFAGMDGHIAKPLDIRKLMKLIDKIISEKEN